MSKESPTKWKPGRDLPYVLRFGESGMLAILLRAEWLKPDRSGQPLLLPPAVRALDRLRAVFAKQERITPGFIVGIRQAMKLTQEGFAQRLGVSKMTVSRWECGRMKPSTSMTAAIRNLQKTAQLEGVEIHGEVPARSKQTA